MVAEGTLVSEVSGSRGSRGLIGNLAAFYLKKYIGSRLGAFDFESPCTLLAPLHLVQGRGRGWSYGMCGYINMSGMKHSTVAGHLC